jgi:hypothetical protein
MVPGLTRHRLLMDSLTHRGSLPGEPFERVRLEQSLLGVYRFQDTFRIFPADRGIDWAAISQHEYTHALLANSTSVGAIHRLLSFLATSLPSDTVWPRLFGLSVDRARDTHEAAATFSELCTNSGTLSRAELVRKHQLPPEYERYFTLLAEVVPEELPPALAIHLGVSIARYCLDVPLEELASCAYEGLRQSAQTCSFPPDVDQRFARVRQALCEDNSIVQALCEAAASVPVLSAHKSEGPEEFFTRRRANSAERSCRIRDALGGAVKEIVPSVPARAPWARSGGQVTSAWREAFANAGDNALDAYITKSIDESVGPDPLTEALEIVFPTPPLSGLVAATAFDALRIRPSLVTATQAGARCELRPGLVLEKGDWYFRYFRLAGGEILRPVFYSISPDLPQIIVESEIPLVIVGDADEMMSGWVRRPHGLAIRTGRRVTGELFDRLLAEQDMKYCWLPWPDVPEVFVLAVHLASTNDLLFWPCMGAGAELAAERLLRNGHSASNGHMLGLIRPFLAALIYLFPDEGKPVAS